MTRNDAVAIAYILSCLDREDAPVSDAWETAGGWDVMLWSSEDDARDDDGARAVWRGTISVD